MTRAPWMLWPLVVFTALRAAPLRAQEPRDSAAGPQEALRVFLDCQRCDFDYFRRQVPWVNYVRDRQDAQLHVLVTSQPTGGGGNEYTFDFIGLREFSAREDTLVYVSRQGDTQDDTRAGQVRTFVLGLVRYVADTPLAERISVDVEAPPEMAEQVVRPEDDPWNFWVFELRVGGSIEGEERQRELSLDGSVEASRITEDLKIELDSRVDWNRQRFELSEGTETSTRRNYSSDALVVWSLGPHWSAGGRASASTSTRDNQDLALRGGPAVEYSLYPYAESSRRQITFQYSVAVASFDYEEVTLFDKLSEVRGEHSLEVSADFTQPWGEIRSSLTAEMFLSDPKQHRLDLFSNLELRITRGLSLDIRGSVARIKNQIFLPREDIPDEDILLERRQLGTDYRYEMDVGLSFTFGSVFNNVVNPRMGGGGDRRFF